MTATPQIFAQTSSAHTESRSSLRSGPGTLAEALRHAVQDVRPHIGARSCEALAAELEARLTVHWGPDHGITAAEMLATARDITTA
jgi:hypothetical protein